MRLLEAGAAHREKKRQKKAAEERKRLREEARLKRLAETRDPALKQEEEELDKRFKTLFNTNAGLDHASKGLRVLDEKVKQMDLPPEETRVQVSLKAVNADDLAVEIFRILKIQDPKAIPNPNPNPSPSPNPNPNAKGRASNAEMQAYLCSTTLEPFADWLAAKQPVLEPLPTLTLNLTLTVIVVLAWQVGVLGVLKSKFELLDIEQRGTQHSSS